MLGYYKNFDLTGQVLTDDGWFHTGDLGTIENNKFLRVTGRKKEIFKLSSGKYIAPQIIENKYKESLFIEHIMVIGEHEKFASAIIVPDYAYIKDWCKENNISVRSNEDLLENDLLKKKINNEIKQFNKTVAEFEKIRRFKLIPDVWTPATGELSATLKLKRNLIMEKYKDQIDKIYRN